jgi:sugar phosphate isomerase/epimerase
LCDYVAKNGQFLHLETGQETAAGLLHFIHAVERENLKVNFDPANMILYGTGEPIPALEAVGAHVRSVHCKDATWSDSPGVTWGAEVPLGAGAVGMQRYLETLDKIGYQGPLTIEREIPQDPQRQLQENRCSRRVIAWPDSYQIVSGISMIPASGVNAASSKGGGRVASERLLRIRISR